VSGTTTLFEITNILNGSDAQNTFELSRDSDAYTITNFGGVGTGTKPSPEAIAQVDTLKFQGEGLTAENILAQEGDLVIGFEGIPDVEALSKF